MVWGHSPQAAQFPELRVPTARLNSYFSVLRVSIAFKFFSIADLNQAFLLNTSETNII